MKGRGRVGRFLALAALLAALCLLAGIDAARRRAEADERFAANRALAGRIGFTDPCLSTDARYTRHPSLADLHSPFQESPLALEHYPSGSLVLPPAHLGMAR
ncbi:MAG: hypothetical protein AB1346_10485 [Thermodesulfobacteriota bacterium]